MVPQLVRTIRQHLLNSFVARPALAAFDRDKRSRPHRLFSCHRFMRRLFVWPSNFSNVYLLLESVSGIEPTSAETMNLRSNHQSRGDNPPNMIEKKRGVLDCLAVSRV